MPKDEIWKILFFFHVNQKQNKTSPGWKITNFSHNFPDFIAPFTLNKGYLTDIPLSIKIFWVLKLDMRLQDMINISIFPQLYHPIIFYQIFFQNHLRYCYMQEDKLLQSEKFGCCFLVE